jgi:UDPglucose--hexose-1-phosphate uridylyltransferase
MIEGSLRRDPLHRLWVVFAPEKVDTIIQQSSENEAKFDIDPYVPGLEYATGKDILSRVNPAYADKGWSSRVFPAKNPILKVENEKRSKGVGLYDVMSRIGAHEVVVETPKNNIFFDQLSIEEIADAFTIMKDRVNDLKKDSRFRYIMVTKNRGLAAGGTIDHNYSEIKAFPFIPPIVQYKLESCKHYYMIKERCLLCDIIEQELFDRKRVVYENDQFIAICPYASRYPFEIMILPRRHAGTFEKISEESVKELAKIAKVVLCKLRKGLNSPAYNCVFHFQPVNSGADEVLENRSYHWHLTIIPRLTRIPSEMLEAGVYVNPTFPEEAAEFLKNIRE